MDEDLQNAIDTVDAARQHKCELEGKLRQLNACISQVSLTSQRSRKDIEQHFGLLQSKISSLIQEKQKELLNEIKWIESDAIKPLEDCKVYLEDGILESNSVIENGEKLLHSVDDPSGDIKKLKKFTGSTAGLSLDSVPEVPSLVDVASISFHYKEKDLCQKICDSIKSHGQISKQAPVQITELEPLPGGMIVSWDECNTEETAEWLENGNAVLYKLQYCHGKVSLVSTGSYSQNHSAFRDAYVGNNYTFRVKKLAPNTAYTFRVSRCLLRGDDKDKIDELEWSPWSVYQSGVTILSGYEWDSAIKSNGYNLQDKSRTAMKRSNDPQILLSTTGGYIIGYPITFRIDVEGKSHTNGDGFALVGKGDSTSSTINKEGSICVTADGKTMVVVLDIVVGKQCFAYSGKIFINGTESKTRFCNFCRNCTIRFNAREIKSDEYGYEVGGKKSRTKYIVLRVTITMMDKEAVFNWKIAAASVTINAANRLCLGFAASFKSQGWKFSVI